MKTILVLATVLGIFCCCNAIQPIRDFLTTPEYNCIQCLCHARTGCYLRRNCARYSINKDYWIRGGRLVVDVNDDPNSDSSYQKCMQDENCIVGTIINYTDSFGERDCNCDNKFDCKDRLAVHLFGEKCANPKFGPMYASRFNDCATRVRANVMLDKEGDETCKGDVLPEAQ